MWFTAANTRLVNSSGFVSASVQLVGRSGATMRICRRSISARSFCQSAEVRLDRRSTCSTRRMSPGRPPILQQEKELAAVELGSTLVLEVGGDDNEAVLRGERLIRTAGSLGVLVLCRCAQVGSVGHPKALRVFMDGLLFRGSVWLVKMRLLNQSGNNFMKGTPKTHRCVLGGVPTLRCCWSAQLRSRLPLAWNHDDAFGRLPADQPLPLMRRRRPRTQRNAASGQFGRTDGTRNRVPAARTRATKPTPASSADGGGASFAQGRHGGGDCSCTFGQEAIVVVGRQSFRRYQV